MKLSKTELWPVTISLLLAAAHTAAMGQTVVSNKKNNPYSPSPLGKVVAKKSVTNPVKFPPPDVVFILQNPEAATINDRPFIVQRSTITAKTAGDHSLPPTEIYKIGIGDVLFVNLKNSAQGSCYCTVGTDGTIDFPLAGERIVALGQTTDTIEELLRSGITLFSDPQIDVKVRVYASHTITVSGLVENPGEKNLRREAMPLYSIRSEAIVGAKANRVLVKRAPLLKSESYDLHDPETDNVLIYPGNSVEFSADAVTDEASYYITGAVQSKGQKKFTAAITLYQAMIASGIQGDPKRATIRHKNENGRFSTTDYDLRSIRKGHAAHPRLEAGDVIEIRK